MNKIPLIIATAFLALSLTGCGISPYDEIIYTMEDGRSVPCLQGVYTLECNWGELK